MIKDPLKLKRMKSKLKILWLIMTKVTTTPRAKVRGQIKIRKTNKEQVNTITLLA